MRGWNKTQVCPWFYILDGIECNQQECNKECKPIKGGKRWK